MRIIDLDIGVTPLILIYFSVAIFILIDVYLLKKVDKNEMNEAKKTEP